jgi:hypothetical protein
MYNTLLIKAYDRITNSWSDTPVTLSNATNKNAKISVGESNDDANFRLLISRDNAYDVVGEEDKVEFYNLVNTSVASSSNLIFSGIIKNLSYDLTTNGNFVNVKCNSFNEVVTRGIVFIDVNNVNVMQFLQAALDSTKNFNLNNSFDVTWDSAFNPTTKEDGSAFPLLNSGSSVKEYYKSLNKVISDYLIPDNTGDGNYYWWITPDNKFRVAKNRDATISSLTLTEGSDFVSVKRTMDSSEVVNFVIVRCGTAPNGDGITTRDQDPVSTTKHGLRFKYIVDMNITSNLIATEKKNNSSSFNDNDLFPNSYPYTITTWTDADGQIVSGADAWVSKVKKEARRIGKTRASDLISKYGDGVLKYSFNMKPTISFSVGTKVRLVISSIGVNDDFEVTDVFYDENGVLVTVKEVVV